MSKLTYNIVQSSYNTLLQSIDSGKFNSLTYQKDLEILAKSSLYADLIHKLATTKTLEKKLAGNFYTFFKIAISNGNLDAFNKLVEFVGDELEEILDFDNWWIFGYAVDCGHLTIINRIIELAGDNLLEMLAANDWYAFASAGENGHMEVFNRLAELAPDNLIEMISSLNWYVFKFAAIKGNLKIINRLAELAPDNLIEMLAASDWYSFKFVVKKGHLAVASRLIELAGNKVVEVVFENNLLKIITDIKDEAPREAIIFLMSYCNMEERESLTNTVGIEAIQALNELEEFIRFEDRPKNRAAFLALNRAHIFEQLKTLDSRVIPNISLEVINNLPDLKVNISIQDIEDFLKFKEVQLALKPTSNATNTNLQESISHIANEKALSI